MLAKTLDNFWHFLRPEGLHNLLFRERSIAPWRHAFMIVFEDALFALLIPPLLVFVLAGSPSPARTLILAWLAYYLFMIIVVFGNEVPRYRSVFTPFALAGAAGGLAVFGDAAGRRRLLARRGLVAGLVLVAVVHAPYASAAYQAMRADRTTDRARAAVAQSDFGSAQRLAAEAASIAPLSPRPWLRYGRALLDAGKPDEAVAAYQEADRLRGAL